MKHVGLDELKEDVRNLLVTTIGDEGRHSDAVVDSILNRSIEALQSLVLGKAAGEDWFTWFVPVEVQGTAAGGKTQNFPLPSLRFSTGGANGTATPAWWKYNAIGSTGGTPALTVPAAQTGSLDGPAAMNLSSSVTLKLAPPVMKVRKVQILEDYTTDETDTSGQAYHPIVKWDKARDCEVTRFDDLNVGTIEDRAFTTTNMPTYALTGDNQLFWSDRPNNDFGVGIWYVASLPDLIDGSPEGDVDHLQVNPDWRRWITLDAATYLLFRDREDTGFVVGEREKVEQRIINNLVARDSGPKRMRDQFSRQRAFGGLSDRELRDRLTTRFIW